MVTHTEKHVMYNKLTHTLILSNRSSRARHAPLRFSIKVLLTRAVEWRHGSCAEASKWGCHGWRFISHRTCIDALHRLPWSKNLSVTHSLLLFSPCSPSCVWYMCVHMQNLSVTHSLLLFCPSLHTPCIWSKRSVWQGFHLVPEHWATEFCGKFWHAFSELWSWFDH